MININVGDSWKNMNYPLINIGDNWKSVSQVWINIGDTWKLAWPDWGEVVGGNQHFIYRPNIGYKTWAWGSGANGQTAQNSTTNVCVPNSIKGNAKTFCSIGSGQVHSFGLDKNGLIWGWGINHYGHLGDNSVTCKSTPVSIGGGNKTFCKITGNIASGAAIDKNGKVWGWGYNNVGQLGDNSVTSRRTPVSILGANKTFCYISGGHSGYFFTAIDKNNRIWTWGANARGQLGDNSVVSRRTPVSILGTNKTFCKIAAGENYALSIDKNGRIWTWGRNNLGQLADNTTVDKSTPISILGANKTFCFISSGGPTSFGIDHKGQVWGWGSNSVGQIGDNSIANKSTPVSILGAKKTFCTISAGYYATVGIEYTGKVWAWGDQQAVGLLGINVGTGSVLTPIAVCNI